MWSVARRAFRVPCVSVCVVSASICVTVVRGMLLVLLREAGRVGRGRRAKGRIVKIFYVTNHVGSKCTKDSQRAHARIDIAHWLRGSRFGHTSAGAAACSHEPRLEVLQAHRRCLDIGP